MSNTLFKVLNAQSNFLEQLLQRIFTQLGFGLIGFGYELGWSRFFIFGIYLVFVFFGVGVGVFFSHSKDTQVK